MFSIARQSSTAKEPTDLRKGMKTIRACLEIIWECQAQGTLQFWALENPASGRLRYFLGKPALIFQPTHYGDTHTKKTAIWGHFSEPVQRPIRMIFGSKVADYDHLKELPEGYVLPPDMSARAARRSITPPGFALAFKEANK